MISSIAREREFAAAPARRQIPPRESLHLIDTEQIEFRGSRAAGRHTPQGDRKTQRTAGGSPQIGAGLEPPSGCPTDIVQPVEQRGSCIPRPPVRFAIDRRGARRL
jgi:hypothetical protein